MCNANVVVGELVQLLLLFLTRFVRSAECEEEESDELIC